MFNIQLNEQALMILGKALDLSMAPHAEVAALTNELNRQVSEQLKKKEEAVVKEDKGD